MPLSPSHQILRVYSWRQGFDGQQRTRWFSFGKRSQHSQGSSRGHEGVTAGGMAGAPIALLSSTTPS